MAITRTPLGTAQGKASQLKIDLTSGYTQGDMIIVGTASDAPLINTVRPAIHFGPAGPDHEYLTLEIQEDNSGNVTTAIWRTPSDFHTSYSWDGTYPFLLANSGSVAQCCWAIKLDGAVNASGTDVALDKSSSGQGASTTLDSGATASLSQTDEIAIACMGWEDEIDDPQASTWTSSSPAAFTDGQGDGTNGGSDASNICVREGYYQTAATTAVEAVAGTLDGNNNWAACVVTYKAAAAGDTTVSVKSGKVNFIGREVEQQFIKSLTDGLVNFNGQFVVTSFQKDLPVLNGVLNLSGQQLTTLLRQNINLGKVNFTGQSVVTSFQKDIRVGSGSFNFNGQSLVSSVQKDLPVGFGNFDFNGRTISIPEVGATTVSVLSGRLQFLGQSIAHELNKVISFGKVNLVGQAVSVSFQKDFTVNTGLLNVTGQSLQSSFQKDIPVSSGQFDFSGQEISLPSQPVSLSILAGNIYLSGKLLSLSIVDPHTRLSVLSGLVYLQGQSISATSVYGKSAASRLYVLKEYGPSYAHTDWAIRQETIRRLEEVPIQEDDRFRIELVKLLKEDEKALKSLSSKLSRLSKETEKISIGVQLKEIEQKKIQLESQLKEQKIVLNNEIHLLKHQLQLIEEDEIILMVLA